MDEFLDAFADSDEEIIGGPDDDLLDRVAALERLLLGLGGPAEGLAETFSDPLGIVTRQLLDGDYGAVLKGEAGCSLLAAGELGSLEELPQLLRRRVDAFVETPAKAYECLVVAATALNVFLQVNYTGPVLAKADLEALALPPIFDFLRQDDGGDSLEAAAQDEDAAEDENGPNATEQGTAAALDDGKDPRGGDGEDETLAKGVERRPELEISPFHRRVAAESTKLLSADGLDAHAMAGVPQMLLLARVLLHAVGLPRHSLWDVPVTTETFSLEKGITPTVAEKARLRMELCEYEKPPLPSEMIPGNVASCDKLATAPLWAARAAVAHARLLFVTHVDDVPTLWFEIRCGFSVAAERMNVKLPRVYGSNQEVDLDSIFAEARSSAGGRPNVLGSSLVLEYGLAQHHLRVGKKGKEAFYSAQGHLQLLLNVTGTLGKKLKYQKKLTAIMRLQARGSLPDDLYSEFIATATDTRESRQEEPQVEEPDSSILEEGEDAMSFYDRTGVAVREIQMEDIVDNDVLEKASFAGKESSEEEPANEDGAAPMQETGLRHPLEQAIVLAHCLDVQNSNPRDGLTSSQMQPYLEAVIENSLNWMVHSTALLERSWVECESIKRRERGIFQIQALVDQHTTRLTLTQSSAKAIEDADPVQKRLRFIHSVTFPPRWELKRDLAQRYASFGAFAGAADIYEELGLWDEVVDCYKVLQRYARAEKLLRKQLEKCGGIENATPRMLVSLGDVTEDPSYYERAWDVSHGRYARAKVQFGMSLLDAGDLEGARDAFVEALRVKPLLPDIWFKLGAVAMRLKDWGTALNAFSQAVMQVPDAAEAWGNVGAIHMRRDNWEAAYPALQEGLKHMRRSWRMWENQFLTTVALGKYGESVYICNQLLDLRDARSAERHQKQGTRSNVLKTEDEKKGAARQPEFDIRYLGMLLKRVVLDGDSGRALRHDHLLDRFGELMQRAVNTLPTDPLLYEMLSMYHGSRGDFSQVIQNRQRQCRAARAVVRWERTKDATHTVLSSVADYANAVLQHGSAEQLYECKMYMLSTMRQVDEQVAEKGEFEEIQRLQSHVEAKMPPPGSTTTLLNETEL